MSWPAFVSGHLAVVLLAAVSTALAHPAVQDRIGLVTEQINEDPENGRLYLRRGELFREKGSWDEAEADYKRAEALAPTLVEIDWARAELALEVRQPARAVELINRYLQHEPDHPRGLLVRARALAALQRTSEASADYRRFVEVAAHPKPDYYLEWAAVLESVEDWSGARQVLRAGLEAFGPITALLRQSLEAELQLGDSESALQTLDRLVETSPRTEVWLVRKAEVLEDIGQLDKARSAYLQADKVLCTRPAGRRHTPRLVEVEVQIRLGLERLAAPAADWEEDRS